MAKILFTGSRGYLGARFLSRHQDEHTIMGIHRHNVNILDKASLELCFRDFRPDYVIHGAAITSTAFAEANPELTRQVNVEGAVNVAEECARYGAKMMFLSTEQVFNGNVEGGPFSEEDIPQPNTVYGATKLRAEEKLRKILDELWILRFTWLFDLPEAGHPVNPNIVWNAFRLAMENEPRVIPMYDFRGHTYGREVVEKLPLFFHLPYGVYHVGSHNNLGCYELTCKILQEMGLESRIGELIIPDKKKFKKRSRDIRLNCGKASEMGIGFPKTRDSVMTCLKDFGLARAFSTE